MASNRVEKDATFHFSPVTSMPNGIIQWSPTFKSYYTVDNIPMDMRQNLHSKAWTLQAELAKLFPKVLSMDPTKQRTTTRKFPRYPTCLILRAKTPADRILVINWWQCLKEETQKYWLNDGLKEIFYAPKTSEETVQEHERLVERLNAPGGSIPSTGQETSALVQNNPAYDKLRRENNQLRQANEALRKENEALKSEIQKRKTEDALWGAKPSRKGRTAKSRKRLFEKWTKMLVRETSKTRLTVCYNTCSEFFTVRIKDDTPWSVEDFESIFGDKGSVIQPTPENKPKSRMTIVEFKDMQSIQEIFGDATIHQHGYTFDLWQKGNFSKSCKLHDHPAEIRRLHVQFDRSRLTLTLEFHMAMVRAPIPGIEVLRFTDNKATAEPSI